MAKRGNNEGSIYPDSDGRWRAAVNAGYRNGKRIRKKFSGRTRAEVAQKIALALRDQQLGIAPTSEKLTVGQFLRQWLEDAAKPKIRPKTYTSYAQLIENHLVPGLGTVRLGKLSAQMVDQFLNDKRCSGLSGRTVQYIHAVLRRALGQAVRWDIAPRNVAKLVDAPKADHHEITPYTPEEARQFLAALQGYRMEALYSVAIALGLRQGEALGLRWSDIDLERGALEVRMQLQRIEKKLVLVELKTEKSRRPICIPAVLRSALNVHRERQNEERLAAGKDWVDSGLVFTTTRGTPIDQRNLLRDYVKVARNALIRKIRFHDLRHTAASLLLAQGVSFKAIQETLGHSDIRTTMNLYAHLYPAMRQEVADKMDAILNPVAPAVAPKRVQ